MNKKKSQEIDLLVISDTRLLYLFQKDKIINLYQPGKGL